MKRLLALVCAAGLTIVGCAPADEASTGDEPPVAETSDAGGDSGNAVRDALTPQAELAMADLSSAFQPTAEEEACVVGEFLDHLSDLDDYDAEDPEQIRTSLRLGRSCLGEETVIAATTRSILLDVPVLDQDQARCAAEGLNDNDDLFVEVIQADVNGTPLTTDGIRSFLVVFRDCDLGSVLVDGITAGTDIPTASVECFVDGIIADDALVIAMAEDTDVFEEGDVVAVQGLLGLYADCGGGELLAQDLLADSSLTGEQATCYISTLAADATLIETMLLNEAGDDDPAVLAATLRIFRDCDMGAALAEDLFGDLSLTDAQAQCAVDQLLQLDEPTIERLGSGEADGEWITLLTGIGTACNITLIDLLGG